MPQEVPRVAVVDTFRDEGEEAVGVADALKDKLRGVLLDTPPERGGVTASLVKEVRVRLDLAGFRHVEIFVSGGFTPERIRAFVDSETPVNGFGVGLHISSAPPNTFTADMRFLKNANHEISIGLNLMEPPTGPPDPVSYHDLAMRSSQEAEGQADATGLEWYRLAEETLQQLSASTRTGQPDQLENLARKVMIENCGRIAAGIVESLQEGDQLLTKAISGSKGPPIISNMVNVSILATKLGMGLGYSRQELMRLAHAGLLHDVGMFMLPESLISSPDKLSSEDRARIVQHPEFGNKILTKLGAEHDWLAQVAWQEHERWGGQGYPRGLSGPQIHEYARVIGIVDIFDALVSPRPYKRRLLPHEAVRELLIAEKASFPSQIIKALVQQFSMFPLGTTVRLNSGEVGTVIHLNPRYPLRPVIQVSEAPGSVDDAGSRTVDLSKTMLIHIVEVVAPDSGG
ncbi:MAG: HD domain-containing protein [Nitrospirae bacterium]|nr:HD domain-containing protein [Nitrospirota bacterium]